MERNTSSDSAASSANVKGSERAIQFLSAESGKKMASAKKTVAFEQGGGTLDVASDEEGKGKLYCGLTLDNSFKLRGISGTCGPNNVQCLTCKGLQEETLKNVLSPKKGGDEEER